jgi:hypothetical protein
MPTFNMYVNTMWIEGSLRDALRRNLRATHIRLPTEKLAELYIIGYINGKVCEKHWQQQDQDSLLGNKGAVGTHFHQSGLLHDIGYKTFLFINSHVNADQKTTEKRSKDLIWSNIRLNFQTIDYIWIYGPIYRWECVRRLQWNYICLRSDRGRQDIYNGW